MGVGERESWTTEEFGASHEGAVGVLLADGSVPDPVFIDMTSAGGGKEVSQWSVYDGGGGYVRAPRAAALRAVCSCGWSGPPHPLRWEEFGEQDMAEAAGDVADTCAQEWDVHTVEVERSAITVPEPLADLLVRVESEIEQLAKTTPLAALRAARRLEVIAAQTAYWPALDARRNATGEQTAAALGLDEDAAQDLLARFGRLSRYH
jgi:hypothetical protein